MRCCELNAGALREPITIQRKVSVSDGMGGQANHRFTTSRSEARSLQAAGWIVEGTVFCALP